MPGEGSGTYTEDSKMNYRMFSDEALKHFRAFASQDATDRARAGRSSNSGAFDAVSPPLKRALIAHDAANEQASLDPSTLSLVLEALRDAFGDEAMGSVKAALDKSFPGLINDLDPESPDTATSEDTSGLDYPPANAGGQAGPMQDDQDFSIEGQFRNAAKDEPPNFPGMPKPGGKMVAQDRRSKAIAADAALRHANLAADSYNRDFPQAGRIGLDSTPRTFSAPAAGSADSYARHFPESKRIGFA
jgi:hypothetical protein